MPKSTTRKRTTARRAPKPKILIIETETSAACNHHVQPVGKRLANSPEEWIETEALIRQHVERVCARYDDKEQAESLYLLIDLMCNQDYDRMDREMIAFVAKNHAFNFTDAFETAQEVTLGKLPQGTELRMVA